MRKALLISTCYLLLTSPVSAQTASQPELWQQAQQALQQGNIQQAVSILETLTRLDAKNTEALNLLARQYLTLQQWDLAWATLQQAHREDKNSPLNHLLKSQVHLHNQANSRALTELKTVEYLLSRQTVDSSPEIWLKLSAGYAELKEQSSALRAFQQAEKLTPKLELDSEMLLLKAQLWPEQADTYQQAALKREFFELPQPSLSSPQLQSLLSTHQEAFKKLIEQEFQALQQALESSSPQTLTRQLVRLERVLQQLDVPDNIKSSTLSQLESLQEKYPKNPTFRSYLVRYYLKNQNYAALQIFYQYELQSQSKSWQATTASEAFKRLADLRLKTGFFELAFKNYEHALSSYPQNSGARQRLGMLYLIADNQSEALKQFNQILEQNPVDFETRLLVALALAFQKNPTQAQAFLEKIPAEIRPELRELVQAVINTYREPKYELLQVLLPENALLEGHENPLP